MYCDLKRYDHIRYLTIRSVNWTLSKKTLLMDDYIIRSL